MSKIITIFLFSASLLGCGSSNPSAKLQTSQNDVVSQNVEIMDLRSSVIILQSEIIGLKENLKIVGQLNQTLQKRIEERSSRLSTLENYSNRYITTNSTETASAELNSENIEDLYKTALTYYFDSNYEESIRRFEQLINVDDSHNLSDNSQYWIGEAYFGLGNYKRALSAFEIVLTYPQSNKNDYAQFKIGLCLLKLKKEPQAYAAFQSFIDSYPESELISRVIDLRNGIQ